jgi:hypothetical protein
MKYTSVCLTKMNLVRCNKVNLVYFMNAIDVRPLF